MRAATLFLMSTTQMTVELAGKAECGYMTSNFDQLITETQFDIDNHYFDITEVFVVSYYHIT